MSLEIVATLDSILVFSTDQKRIWTPHSFFCDFKGDKSFMTCWSDSSLLEKFKFGVRLRACHGPGCHSVAVTAPAGSLWVTTCWDVRPGRRRTMQVKLNNATGSLEPQADSAADSLSWQPGKGLAGGLGAEIMITGMMTALVTPSVVTVTDGPQLRLGGSTGTRPNLTSESDCSKFDGPKLEQCLCLPVLQALSNSHTVTWIICYDKFAIICI